MPGNIVIACCTLGRIRVEHEMAVLHHAFPLGRTAQFRIFMGLTTVDGRNWAVKEAIDLDAEYLLYWDDDMIPRSPSAVDAVVTPMAQNPDIDIVGAVYPMRRKGAPEPIVIKEKGCGVWWGWQDGGLHPVYMTGTGFTAIRVASLKQLDVETYSSDDGKLTLPRVFGRKQISDGENVGRMADDEYLAELCAQAGLSWYVAGNVICDQIDLDGRVYRVEDARVAVPAAVV